MHVSQFTRWTACFRLMRQLGVARAGNWLLAERFEDAWRMHCGLRNDDLRRTLREMVEEGVLKIHLDADGAVLELTDRGAMTMSGDLDPAPLRQPGFLRRLYDRLHTEWVLDKAGRRVASTKAPRLVPFDQERRRAI